MKPSSTRKPKSPPKPKRKQQQQPKRSKNDKAALFEYYWKLLAPPKAPRLMPEYQFALPEKKSAFDYKLARRKIGIEIDGGQFVKGGGRHNTDADRYKHNLAAALGYRVFHFSPQALEHDPVSCINLVLRAVGLDIQN